jgi:hypothetical protein
MELQGSRNQELERGAAAVSFRDPFGVESISAFRRSGGCALTRLPPATFRDPFGVGRIVQLARVTVPIPSEERLRGTASLLHGM